MLDKIIMLPFTFFLIFLFAFFAVTGLAMFNQWMMVQSQAQFVASSMGKWGGYTHETEQIVSDFANRINKNRSDIKVDISGNNSIPWGTPITARVTIPFDFKVGKYKAGEFELTGVGRAVSSYLPGSYNVSYTFP